MPLFAILMIGNMKELKVISFSLSPPFLFLFLLLMWAGVSIFWAVTPIPALKTFASLCITFIFSFLFLSLIQKATPEVMSRAYLILTISGLILGFLILAQVMADSFQVGLIKKYAGEPFMMKPTGSILGLLGFVGCAFLWINNHKILSILTYFLFILLIYLTLCQTALYALLIGSCIFVLSYTAPFWTTRVALIFSYTFLILSPVLSVYVFTPPQLSQVPLAGQVLGRSFYHRVLAWEFYSMKFFEKPFLGWGVESARYLPSDQQLAEGFSNVIHPHNNAVQIYAELGLIGGILFALFFASLFRLVEQNVKDRLSIAVCNATIVFAFIEAEITHNVWRNYWLSLVTLVTGLIFLFLKVREGQLRGAVGHSKPVLAPEMV